MIITNIIILIRSFLIRSFLIRPGESLKPQGLPLWTCRAPQILPLWTWFSERELRVAFKGMAFLTLILNWYKLLSYNNSGVNNSGVNDNNN